MTYCNMLVNDKLVACALEQAWAVRWAAALCTTEVQSPLNTCFSDCLACVRT